MASVDALAKRVGTGGIESYAVLLGLLRALHIVKGQQASEVIYKLC
jgi:hypothetical protein